MDKDVERYTCRETALHLIDSVEYKNFESIYGEDVYKIANELDVTAQIVQYYRRCSLSCCHFSGGTWSNYKVWLHDNVWLR